ncbi:MAG TPA: DUF2892 domain-containing protein [Gemmatimonadaceae bacterium]|nr:DUF2892 domain-containing protein [Gemmatimonadaceae bacterium]
MRANTGTLDRWVRVIVGLVILSLVFFGPRSGWGWLGLIPLLTGVSGYCPLYQLLGRSTGRAKPHSAA